MKKHNFPQFPTCKLFSFNGDISLWNEFWAHCSCIDAPVSETQLKEEFSYLIKPTTLNYRIPTILGFLNPFHKICNETIKVYKKQSGKDDRLFENNMQKLFKLISNHCILGLASLNNTLKRNLLNAQNKLNTILTEYNSYGVILFVIKSCLSIGRLKIWQHSNSNCNVSLREHIDARLRPSESLANQNKAIYSIYYHKSPSFSYTRQQYAFFNDLSTECFKATNKTLNKKKALLAKERRTCFVNGKNSHLAREFNCSLCSQRNFGLKDFQPTPAPSNHVVFDPDHSELSHSFILGTGNEVYLQTFTAVLYNNGYERRVRVLVDSGSQRSYVLSSLVAEMGYESLGEESLIHSLFGGRSAGVIHHSRFKIHLRSIAGDYACNFTALDQSMIAASIPVATLNRYGKLELVKHCIELTEDMASPIDVLIGADVAGKIWCGPRVVLSSGLVAVNTLFGWTLMGAVGSPRCRRFRSATPT